MTTSIPIIPMLEKLPFRLYLICTGGGAGLQQALWSIPGASSFFVGAEFPYGTEMADRALGFKPDRYVNERVAISYAMEAYYRAYLPGGPKAVGVGLTASTASNKEHRGDHRIHASWFSEHGCKVATFILPKGVGPEARRLDGETCDLLGAAMIAEAVGADPDIYFENLDSKGAGLLAREVFFERPYFSATGKRLTLEEADVEALFPGAFNPPHEGHFGMAKVFRKLAGVTPTFHMTAETPHKPALAVSDMLQRAKLLEGHDRMFTRADPLYVDKAEAFPGVPMIIGTDALKRMLDPKWGIEPDALGAKFEQLGTTFFVTERSLEGETIRVEELVIPGGMNVEVLPGRWNVSSSEVRAKLTSSTS